MTEEPVTNNKDKHSAKPTLIKLILLIAAFLALLNEVSTNIAFPLFMAIFGVSVSTVQWLTTGFMLVMTAIMPATAFIIRRFNTRQIFFATMFLLITGTLLSGLALNFPQLLVGRLLQAAGTCVVMSLLVNTILQLTPIHERGATMGVVSLVLLFAPAIAPTLAGIVIHNLNWRWLYLGLTPLFIVMTVVAYFILNNISATSKVRIDWVSLLLSTLSFICILYGISCAGEAGIARENVGILFVVGFLALGLFVWRQVRIEEPLLDMGVFKYPMFTFGVILIIFTMMFLFAILVYVPMFLQSVYGLSTSATGMAMLPAGILSGALAPFIGRLFDKIGPKPLIISGVIILMASAWQLAAVSASTSISLFISIHCCFLAGITMILSPAQTHGLNQLPKPLYPHGTAVMTTVMQLGGGLGTALFVNLVAVSQKHFLQSIGNVTADLQQTALVYGFRHAFQAEELLLLACLAIALCIKQPIAESRF